MTHVKMSRRPSSVVYTITGSPAEVDLEISKLFSEYHPWGYGTTLEARRPLEDGQEVASVWRRASCD